MPVTIRKTRAIKAKAKKPVMAAKHLAGKRFNKPAQSIHAQPMRSMILRRSVVKKPKVLETKMQAKTSGLSKAKPEHDKARLSKALNVAKSSRVRRFGAPVRTHRTPSAPRPAAAISGGGQVKLAGSSASLSLRAMPSLVASASHNRLERMLDEALVKADSHSRRRAKPHKAKQLFKKRSWLITMVVIILIALGATLFLAWRSLPQVSMGVASLRSNIKGSIPSYAPAGFEFDGPIDYNKQSLTMKFADSSGRSYLITEAPSNLSSRALETNDVPHSSQIQSSQIKGTTVYIYDSANNATWVNDGVKFTIQNKAKLGTDEILKIADSL